MPSLEPLTPGRGFTVVHSADLHLGSGMRIAKTLGRLDDLKDVTYEALDNLVSLVEAEEADVLTLGGDLFDEPNLINPGPRHRLAHALERIPRTRVAVVRGNHDHHAPNAPQVRWPAHVFEFDPEHRTLDLGPVRIHGVSYQQAREARTLLPRYPPPTGAFDIGLLHANVGGTTGHADYAPCTLGELVRFGYRMWLLGHIHQRQVLAEDPLVLYPGNLQGRDAGETGPKTAEVIDVSGAGTITHRPEPVHSVLWDRLDVDVGGTEDIDEVIDRCTRRLDDARRRVSARGMVARVRLTGTTRAHAALCRTGAEPPAQVLQGLLNERHGNATPFLLVDRVEVATCAEFDLERLAQTDDIAGILVRMSGDPSVRAAILDELADKGPAGRADLEPLAADLWPDALQDALVRLRGGDGRAD